MSRFFINPQDISGCMVKLDKDSASHLTVTRARPGDNVTVSDGLGVDYFCKIKNVSRNGAVLEILNSFPSATEPGIRITLLQSIPKADKMELVIQKAVELGVHEIIPVETMYSVAKLKDGSNKHERWQKISEAAAKQSERGKIPVIGKAMNLPEALSYASELDELYVAYEKEKDTSAKAAFGRSAGRRIGLFIGPEGGFSEDEMILFKKNKAVSFSLGNRILRTETAGLTAIIILLFIREEL